MTGRERKLLVLQIKSCHIVGGNRDGADGEEVMRRYVGLPDGRRPRWQQEAALLFLGFGKPQRCLMTMTIIVIPIIIIIIITV